MVISKKNWGGEEPEMDTNLGVSANNGVLWPIF